ncbi:WXG100 family type VII secretion target [Motilibacter peucedani]|uniref:WXG100 family type VII secretion target n=1 Tax=Motilibacter peucedani TaxID=598650 RepID=A0A420XT14_9ACTN|nr:WXG100 family type VII secretion target [Motilibacter peucedani]RKS79966.1 WXG100 family type VII secretion target [Motilibacter peucedani]
MANLSVTYHDMSAAGAQLKAGKAEIEQTLRRLSSLVTGLVAQGYVTDSSSRAFSASYDEFDAGVVQVVGGLEGMGAYLETAARTFQEADATLAQAFR